MTIDFYPGKDLVFIVYQLNQQYTDVTLFVKFTKWTIITQFSKSRDKQINKT